MRRMITDNQLNDLKSTNLKIIELDDGISNATITQEQLDIFFPKDKQGNIYKPDYYIVIIDTITDTSGGFAYLGFWSATKIRFNRLGTDSYYTWTIGPNDTKFTQIRTNINQYHLYQHNIYIKTDNLYIFLTLINTRVSSYPNINNIGAGFINGTSCTGYLTQGSQGPITSIKFDPTDGKYYFSLGAEGKDYAFFEASEIKEFLDNVEAVT